MDRSPRVSVILPVYKGAEVVGGAITSIIEQTFTDWELIAIDDGGLDNSFEVLQDFAAQDSRIRPYQNPKNIGQSATLNRAIRLARGEYIAIQEQDDFSMPDRLESQVAVLDEHPDVCAVSGVSEWLDDDLKPFNHVPGMLLRGEQFPQEPREMFEFLYVEGNKFVNAAAMYRKEALERFDPPYNEQARQSMDWELILRLARHCRIWGLPQVIVQMRRGPGWQNTTKNKELMFSSSRRCLNTIYRDYRSGPEPRVTFSLWRRAFARELILEARTWGGVRGLWLLAQSLILNPADPKGWETLRWFGGKITRSLTGNR